MGMIYFPSCKFTANYPRASQAVKDYLNDRHGADIAGCCRPNLGRITAADTAVCICHTCAAFVAESTPATRVLSLWELLVQDGTFTFPDHGGRCLTVQDCWRSHDNRAEQEAVRHILVRMNIEAIELPDNFAKTRFCGASLYEPLPSGYDRLAPKRLGADAAGLFRPHTHAEKAWRMAQHCASITTPDVLCYCVACAAGIALGGKNAVHLAQLVFG